ncbi:hypothetical protein Clacol_009447 [Clathrus columnatus]|uniref:DUF6699 domain-containing protein n=1 Tax=Clathrus columnatus TaxID=1419009 RepID=A0AAV5AN04_9AGAM|nr:hypothetical protein Clacol_009447 [Clathrus columnatus]
MMIQPNSYDINDSDLTRKITPLVNMNYGLSYEFKKDSELPVIEAEKRFRRVGDSDAGSSWSESSLFHHPLWRQMTPSHVIGGSRANRNQDSLNVLQRPRKGTRSGIEYKPHPLLCEGRLVWDVSVHPSKACILSKEKTLGGGGLTKIDINSSRIRFQRATSPPLNNIHLEIQCGNRYIPWVFAIRSEGDRHLHITICLLLEALYGVLQEPLEFYEWCCLDDKVKFDPSAIENKWSTHNARHMRLANLSSPLYRILEEDSAVKRIDTLGNNTKFLSLKFSDEHGAGDVRNPWVITLGPK